MRKIVNMVQMSEEEFKAWRESKKEIRKLKGYLDDAQKVGERLMTENVMLSSEAEGLRSENQVLKAGTEELKREIDKLQSLVSIKDDRIDVMIKRLDRSDREVEVTALENEKLKKTISNMEEANNILRKNLDDVLAENERICRSEYCKDQEDEIKELKNLIAIKDAHINTLINYLEEANSAVTRLEKVREILRCKLNAKYGISGLSTSNIGFSSEASTGVTIIITK